MIDINKISKKINVSYARYLKFKRADRYAAADELSFAEKHSQRVAGLKKFIIRMVVLLTLLLIVWPLANKNWAGSKISFQNEEQQKDAGKNSDEKPDNSLPVMLKPNFYGNDDHGQPFNISAVSGVSVNENKVILNDLVGEMYLQDNSKVNIQSPHGDYAANKKELLLNDGVVLITDNGYQFETNSAFVKMNENMATGSEKVKIKGRLGDIDANGFILRNSGEEIVLFGGVHLVASIDKKDIKSFNEENTKKDAPVTKNN